MSTLYIGVMSGTSLDGVDAVLADFSQGVRILGHSSRGFSSELRLTLLQLNQSGPDELHTASLAANQLALIYAQTVQDVLHSCGCQPTEIAAIGAHGQTVRHQPGLYDGVGYTIQINNPSLLAERTGIRVVADFRSRDVAAGGQGAPLVPAFHQHMFAQAGHTVAVLNIGGISNLSVLTDQAVTGFDCGPGNVLMDLWCHKHNGEPYDREGALAASGHVMPELLKLFMSDPFFFKAPPKSTGRDLFHAAWLQSHLSGFASASVADIQATLTAFTARACADDVLRYAPDAVRLLVCGGGAYNCCLMEMLKQFLPGIPVQSTEQHGLPPLQVEAAAFAWLARQTCLDLSANLPAVTGASGPRVLGAIYPA